MLRKNDSNESGRALQVRTLDRWDRATANNRVDVREGHLVRYINRYTIPFGMSHDELLDLFRRAGALLGGHFRLSSGLHSSGYLQSALVLQYPSQAEALGRELAATSAVLHPTVVLSPALGGVVIGQEVGRALGVRAIFAERQDGSLTLRRGFALEPSDRVLIVEDAVTTGGSTRETMAVATGKGAQVVGVACIVDRSGGQAQFGVPFRGLLELSLPLYQPEVCPMCREGAPVDKPGSRPVAT